MGGNLFSGIGFAVGLVIGVVHLIAMTRNMANQGRRSSGRKSDGG
jgi:hypothetical protein